MITVADNGLAYTAVAELAGAAWSGRALGVQNTVQNIAAVATAPVLAAVIGDGALRAGFRAGRGVPAAGDPADAGARRARVGGRRLPRRRTSSCSWRSSSTRCVTRSRRIDVTSPMPADDVAEHGPAERAEPVEPAVVGVAGGEPGEHQDRVEHRVEQLAGDEQERHDDRRHDLDADAVGGVLHAGHERQHRAGQHGQPERAPGHPEVREVRAARDGRGLQLGQRDHGDGRDQQPAEQVDDQRDDPQPAQPSHEPGRPRRPRPARGSSR